MAIQRAKRDEQDWKEDVPSRLARLETSQEGVIAQVASLETEFHTFADRQEREFGRIRQSFVSEFDKVRGDIDTKFQAIRTDIEARRQPLGVWISAATLLVTLFFAVGAACYVPVWITTNNVNSKAQEALDWQKDYERGRLPSSADPKIAELTTSFKEVETQFRGVNKEIQTQIDHNKDALTKQESEIGELRGRITDTERSAHINTTRLDDHEKFLWPDVERQRQLIRDLNGRIEKIDGIIDEYRFNLKPK
jgi:hypothetical protein